MGYLSAMASYAEEKLSTTSRLRSLASGTQDLALVAKGVTEYLLRGRTSASSFHSMLRLHCRTNGRSTRYLNNLFGKTHAKRKLALNPESESYFSAITSEGRDKVAAEIREQGFGVLPVRLSDEACDALTAFSLQTPAQAIGTRAEVITEKKFDEKDPAIVRFKFKCNDIVTNEVVQKLISDPVLIDIGRRYFESPPLVDSVAMWWSLAKGAAPSSDLAQLYHFDYDRTKWLKVFFYLNDIDANSGPHVFVRGSHRSDERRAPLLKRGYVRIPDSDIEATYGRDAVVEIGGKRGTVFMEDTSGFHKGKAPISGNRLLFEIQFCINRFGAPYEQVALPPERVPSFDSFQAQHPWLYPIFGPA